MNKKWIKNFLRFFVVVAAVIVLAATQDLPTLLNDAKELAVLPMVGGVMLFMLANCLVAFRWCGLLAALNIHFPFIPSLKVTFVGLFYNNVMLSAIGGDLLRGWYVTKYTEKRLEAAFSVMVDRACGLLGCGIMAVVGLFFARGLFEAASEPAIQSQQAEGLSVWVKLAAVLALGLIFAVIVAIILYKKGKLKYLVDNFYSHFGRFIAAIILYLRNPLALLSAVCITLVGQSLTVSAIYVAAKPLGIDVSISVFFIIFPLSWVIGTLPISPGGLGVLELGIVAMFAALPQVSAEQALMLALCQRIIFLAGGLPGLVIHLTGKHLPKTS